MQIKAGMENVEEDIAQEGNANKGKALRWCLRNREARMYMYVYIYMYIKMRGKGGRDRNGDRKRMRRHREKVRKRAYSRTRGYGKEGWSARMVSRRSLAVWHPYSANYHYTALVGLHEVALPNRRR